MDTLPDLFGATFLINLLERVDRLRSAKRQFARLNWKVGHSGVRVFPALKFSDAAGFPNAATRGCFHSHLECLRCARAEGQESVLILEDDIGLTSALPRLTSSIKSMLAAERWDLVNFGHYTTANIPSANHETNEKALRFDLWTGDIVGTHFYAVNARILPRLIAHFNKLLDESSKDAGPMSPDGAYNVFRRNNPDVRCLIAHPKLGWQGASRSDLSPHPLDKIPLFRPVNGLLRALKQKMRDRNS